MKKGKKITLATFKSFVRKNRENLHVRVESSFDGMVDCVMGNDGAKFEPAQETEYNLEATLGIEGIWLVRGSRDYFEGIYDNEGNLVGIHVWNCTGSFTVAA